MRSSNIIRTLETAVLVVPLLAACDTSGAGGGGNSTGDGLIPICAGGEALSTNSSGKIVCKGLPPDVTALPNCDPNTQALTSSGQSPTCTNRNEGTDSAADIKRVNDVNTKIMDLGTRIDKVANAGTVGSGLKSYVGFSATSLTGHIKNKGDTMLGMGVLDNGLLAAAKFCEKDFGAGARMCTVGDIYNSAVNGSIKRDKLVTETTGLWVYSVAMQNPLNANPAAGLSDNCAGYTYETADAAWRGTAFQWRAADTTVAGKGDVAPHFYIVACSSSHKIACCK